MFLLAAVIKLLINAASGSIFSKVLASKLFKVILISNNC